MRQCIARVVSAAVVLVLFHGLASASGAAGPLRIATFNIDASPPVGAPLAYDPTKEIESPLSCRGVVILSDQKPIVMVAIDWIGISNGGQTVFREALAKAAGTDPERVVIHTLHQHDAPRCDFLADELTTAAGLQNAGFDVRHARGVVREAAAAVEKAIQSPGHITHIGLGEGVVEKVASNRRILGPDGKVLHTRYTATTDPEIRAFPAGTIDPKLKAISFWNDDQPLAVLTYYATHPQSYYRTGLANPDFPGMARNAREEELDVPHIHFNGAGGNIGAGKWNDGAHENRQILADRVAEGMRQAWEATEKFPVSAADLAWKSLDVLLPVADHLDEQELAARVQDQSLKPAGRYSAAKHLVWLRRCKAGDPIPVSLLALGKAHILHMPGELFVEYQLAAQEMAPDKFVAMAAYGEYAPGYIGTEIAYEQGGYETSAVASRVQPDVEKILMDAMREVLDNGE